MTETKSQIPDKPNDKRNPYIWTPLKKTVALILAAVIIGGLYLMCLDTGFLPGAFIEVFSGDKVRGIGLFKDLLHPDLSKDVVTDLSLGMLKTIEMGFLGTILAVVFSFPLAFIGAFNLMGRRWPQKGLFYSTRGFFNAVRAFEAFILVLILVGIFGYNELAGILAIGIHSIGMLGKLYAEAIENADRGQIEAIQAVGGSRLQVICYGIIPQTFPLMLGYTLYRFDINVRMAYILGYIGIGGIGTLVFQYIQWFDISKLSTGFIITLIVISLIDYLSTYVRNRIMPQA